jgi:holo-[acyl-carrier protein] synthase
MKVTTGIDIIEVERIKEAILEMGDSFLNRIYTEKEIEYCNKSEVMKYQHFAARFAAKEAVFKAISEYIDGRKDAIWKDIEIINSESGKPEINVDKLKENINKTGDNVRLINIDVSISHIRDFAVASAVVLIEK